MSSTSAFQPGPYWSVYAATKGYVLSFTEALVEDCMDTGVTLTAFCSGPTKTGFEDAANMEMTTLFKTLKVA